MDGIEVRELIQKWREVSGMLEEKQKELETAREDLRSLKSNHTNAVQRWEDEKTHIQKTITRILDEVSSKKGELQLMENEMQQMQEKIEERVQRNKEYASIISGRRAKVERAIKEAEKLDAEPKAVFENFVANRDAIKKKLQDSIKGIKEQSSVSFNAHLRYVHSIREKIASVVRNRSIESHSWVIEQGTHCSSAKRELRQLLVDEAATSVTKKELWAGILSEIHNLSTARNLDPLSSYNSLFQGQEA